MENGILTIPWVACTGGIKTLFYTTNEILELWLLSSLCLCDLLVVSVCGGCFFCVLMVAFFIVFWGWYKYILPCIYCSWEKNFLSICLTLHSEFFHRIMMSCMSRLVIKVLSNREGYWRKIGDKGEKIYYLCFLEWDEKIDRTQS